VVLLLDHTGRSHGGEGCRRDEAFLHLRLKRRGEDSFRLVLPHLQSLRGKERREFPDSEAHESPHDLLVLEFDGLVAQPLVGPHEVVGTAEHLGTDREVLDGLDGNPVSRLQRIAFRLLESAELADRVGSLRVVSLERGGVGGFSGGLYVD